MSFVRACFLTVGSLAFAAACSGSSIPDGSAGAAGSAGHAGGTGCGTEAKACDQSGDCALATPGCCVCGMPELGDVAAVNHGSVTECSCSEPACGCAVAVNPNLAATCVAGACEAFDVRQEPAYSGCTLDGDCQLRMGLSCCEACEGSDFELVAVNKNASALAQALCTGTSGDCLSCTPTYPTSKKAACVAGHCQVVDQ